MPEQSSFKGLREGEREIRKSIILDATVNLFKEKGFHAVGMRDIAAVAGISAATIYRYFPSRDDIIVEALIQGINAIEKELDTVLGSGSITLEDLAIAVVDYFFYNETVFQMMCYFLTSSAIDPEANKKFNMVSEYFLNMFNMKLKSKGIVTDALASQAFFASVSGVVLTFLHYPGLNDDEKRTYMHRLALAIIKGEGGLTLLAG
ncbi:MAG: TetR/AcrR family transcriptional regulator [Thermodesulfobacteriota bacterium]